MKDNRKFEAEVLARVAAGEMVMAGGAFDDNLLLFEDLTFDGTSANGTAVVVGRSPNRNAEVTLLVELPETTEGVLTCTVKLSLDGTNYTFTICTLEIGNDSVGFSGIVTGKCSWPIVAWEKYTAANIKVRATVVDGDNDGASAWGKVRVYLGFGEETIYGRAPGVADDIIGD